MRASFSTVVLGYPIAEPGDKRGNVAAVRGGYDLGLSVIAELSLGIESDRSIFDRLLGDGELRVGREVLGEKGLGARQVALGEVEVAAAAW